MICCHNKIDTTMEMNEPQNNQGTESNHEQSKSGKYGKKRNYDPAFKGPIANRSCTDIICCILFFLLLLAMIGVGAAGFIFGNPKRLLYPTDSQGNYCGAAGNFSEKKNLFFFDLVKCIPTDVKDIFRITTCPTPQICVKDCPKENTLAVKASSKTDLFCKYNTDKTKSAAELVKSGECAKYTLKSKALAYRCVPTIGTDALEKWLKGNPILNDKTKKNITRYDIQNGTLAQAILLNLQDIGKRVIEDVRHSGYWMLAGIGISVAASFLYIVIMQLVADILVWLTTYAVLSLNGYAVYYCFNEYRILSKEDKSDLNFHFTSNLSSYKDQKETWLVGGILLAVILLVLLLLLIALRKRISLAIQLVKEGSKSISAMPSTLLFPLFPWLLQLMLFAWFIVVLAYLATSGVAEFKAMDNNTITDEICKQVDKFAHWIGHENVTCNFAKYNTRDNILRLQIFHLFAWFWVMNFIVALGQCVLAGTFAQWYWAWDKKRDVPTFHLLSSLSRTLRYHIGSLAFGSLIIAIIQIIRAALEYIEYKLMGHGRTEPGPVARFFLKCLKCCFWCLEKFMKFLNKNAYIEIAIYGKNFCVSAKNAFFLLMRNILRVAVLDKVTDFLLFIGKVTLTLGAAFGSYYFFQRYKKLNYNFTPTIILTVATWFIASAFFGVFHMAIDTVFLCFLEDIEQNDGSQEKPYYMNKRLRKILGKKKKKETDDDDD